MALEHCTSLWKYLHFYPGDINGFLQLFFDNLGTILGLIGVFKFVALNFGEHAASAGETYAATVDSIVFQRSIPGIGFTMVFGNIYYAYMGLKLAKKKDEEGDTSHTTALPYGVNTPGAFAFLFNIIISAYFGAVFGTDCFSEADDEVRDVCFADAAETAWRTGVVANFIAGLISMALGLVGRYIPYVTPTLALLTSLAGIGISFLGIGFMAKNFSEPLAGLLPFFMIFMTYFADIDFGPIPISLLIVVVGSILGWADGVLTTDDLDSASSLVQVWGTGEGFSVLGDFSNQAEFIGITLPVAVAAAAGSLMNVYSARRAGDNYGITEVMVSDGFGTIVAALFGTPFGTSVYIGHPAYKKMGAGVVYSLLNCVVIFFFSVFGVFGLLEGLIPDTAIAPLLVFVGLSICKEAMEEAKPRHYPAYMVGILPDFIRWVTQQGATLQDAAVTPLHWGLVALSRSSLLVALVLTTILVYMADRNFLRATIWLIVAAWFSLISLIHQGAVNVDHITEHNFLSGGDDCFVGFGYCIRQSGDSTCVNSTLTESFTDAFTQKTTPIRFFGGYMMTAALTFVFYLLQRLPEGNKFKIADPINDEDMEPEFKSDAPTQAI